MGKKRSLLRKAVPPPIPLEVNYILRDGPVEFSLGSQTWDSSSDRCEFGDWDGGDAEDFFGEVFFGDTTIPKRQADCKFDCSIPVEKKRSLADAFGNADHLLRGLAVRAPSRTEEPSPSPVEDNLFQVRALSDRPPAWQKYAPSGARFYKEWQDKTGEDAALPCDFDDVLDFVEPKTFARPAVGIRDTLLAEGFSTEREYYAITVSAPKGEHPIADFSNTISGTSGVFLANANNRGALPSNPTDELYDSKYPDGRQPVPFHFSAVAWWMWKKSVLSAHPEWVEKPKEADYSTLKAFFRRNIDNKETREILDEAFKDHDAPGPLEWTPENTDEDKNPFWALLGSPNGNGVQHFATDNKVALKGKGIVKIKAVILEGAYTMWMLFE